MPTYDVIIRNGTIYNGRGTEPTSGDVALSGDRIAAVGEVSGSGRMEIDASGLAVAPGFINMLSWAVESLIHDGRSQSDIRQGVTLEVMGEDFSFGPLTPAMREKGLKAILNNPDITYEIPWLTLGEYLTHLENKGVSCNVTSFVGLGTLRRHAVGEVDRQPTAAELQLMKDLVHQAMQEGAVGLSAALIYPPSAYVKTDEIIELAKVVSEYDGLYISHLRSEGALFLDALEEFITIVKEADVRGEVYHLKAAGHHNWDKLDAAVARIERARRDERLPITADMYTYRASGTDLNATLPPWAHDGGLEALLARLRDPETRERIKKDMNSHGHAWENMWLGPPTFDDMLLAGFGKPEMKHLTGMTLQQVANQRGTAPDETCLDLLLEAGGKIFTIYFTMDEANVRKQIALPWVSFCSDAESLAPEGAFLKTNPHPRAYGSFARLLGHYVREEQLTTLTDAIRRLTSFPASVLKLKDRGVLEEGYLADVVVFDPDTIADKATFERPHQYAVGMHHVFVNGEQVLKEGEHTGAMPGRFVKGPGAMSNEQ